MSRSQIVLAWLLHRQPLIRPIIGASTTEQLDAALDAAELDLSTEEMAQLDAPT